MKSVFALALKGVYTRIMAKMIGKTHDIGPGGKNCSCCYPAPRAHTKMNRAAKRRERQAWKKEVSS